MSGKTTDEILTDLEHSVAGLLIEVRGLRIHMGSGVHFLEMAVEDLQKILDQVRAGQKP